MRFARIGRPDRQGAGKDQRSRNRRNASATSVSKLLRAAPKTRHSEHLKLFQNAGWPNRDLRADGLEYLLDEGSKIQSQDESNRRIKRRSTSSRTGRFGRIVPVHHAASVWETLGKHVSVIGAIARLLVFKFAITHDPTTRTYTDVASVRPATMRIWHSTFSPKRRGALL